MLLQEVENQGLGGCLRGIKNSGDCERAIRANKIFAGLLMSTTVVVHRMVSESLTITLLFSYYSCQVTVVEINPLASKIADIGQNLLHSPTILLVSHLS